MTLPTPPRDLSETDRNGVAGTLHTPDPAAVARLRALMAERTQQPTTPQAEAIRRQYSGDRIAANIQRAAAAVNARRMFVLSDDDMADVEQRRAAGESWERIAKVYHMAHTTLMAAYERQTRARRRAGLQQENPQ
jgi:hypothetical protein